VRPQDHPRDYRDVDQEKQERSQRREERVFSHA
jgi:hypothetical protein